MIVLLHSASDSVLHPIMKHLPISKASRLGHGCPWEAQVLSMRVLQSALKALHILLYSLRTTAACLRCLPVAWLLLCCAIRGQIHAGSLRYSGRLWRESPYCR